MLRECFDIAMRNLQDILVQAQRRGGVAGGVDIHISRCTVSQLGARCEPVFASGRHWTAVLLDILREATGTRRDCLRQNVLANCEPEGALP